MISVAEESEKPLQNAATDIELYEKLRSYIGYTVLIRRAVVERVGILQRVGYNRDDYFEGDRPYFSLGKEEVWRFNRLHRIEILMDGVWKVLNPGSPINERL